MKIHIEEEQFELSINQWDDFTLGLFKLYADWRCNGNTNANSNTNSNTRSNGNANTDINQQEEPLKLFIHNPDVGTPISDRGRKPQIEEWIHRTKKLEFTLEEYFQIYPKQRQNIAMVYTHISRLINKKSLLQIGENRFKIMV